MNRPPKTYFIPEQEYFQNVNILRTDKQWLQNYYKNGNDNHPVCIKGTAQTVNYHKKIELVIYLPVLELTLPISGATKKVLK